MRPDVLAVFGSGSTNECLYCGAHVSNEFRRVYGDEQQRAHRCPECDSYNRLMKGSAAGKDVDVPDPVHAPGRHGGEPDGV